MNQLLSIIDDSLVVKKLSVEHLSGPTEVTDDITISGNLYSNQNLKVKKNVDITGTLTVDTIRVKNLLADKDTVTASANEKDYTFIAKTEELLVGKGLTFIDNIGPKQLVYKEGNKLYSTMNLDLQRDLAIQIGGVDVLKQNRLGSSIVESNLRKIGTLRELNVEGPVNFDDYVFFNSGLNKVGINIESPTGTLGIVTDNGSEVIIDSKDNNALIGTSTNNGLEFITNNKSRISISSNGEINFGHEKFKNAIVKINGILEVDQLITGRKQDEISPVIFRSTETNTIQGTGLLWQHKEKNRHFTYSLDPDRIFSTENIDLAANKYFSIDGRVVLTAGTLGPLVLESSLKKLGTLDDLKVAGSTTLNETFIQKLQTPNICSNENFCLTVENSKELSIEYNGPINVGDTDNIRRPIYLNGNVNVAGTLNIGNNKIMFATKAPSFGSFLKGDICYNSDPNPRGQVGWVCVQTGDPGRWNPFGTILPD